MGGLLARPSTTYFYDYEEDAWRWRWGGQIWRWSVGSCEAWQETEEGSLVKDCNCLWQGVAPPSWEEWEDERWYARQQCMAWQRQQVKLESRLPSARQ